MFANFAAKNRCNIFCFTMCRSVFKFSKVFNEGSQQNRTQLSVDFNQNKNYSIQPKILHHLVFHCSVWEEFSRLHNFSGDCGSVFDVECIFGVFFLRSIDGLSYCADFNVLHSTKHSHGSLFRVTPKFSNTFTLQRTVNYTSCSLS